LAGPQWTVYSQNSYLSTTDLAQVRQSLPAKDQHPNHRAMPLTRVLVTDDILFSASEYFFKEVLSSITFMVVLYIQSISLLSCRMTLSYYVV